MEYLSEKWQRLPCQRKWWLEEKYGTLFLVKGGITLGKVFDIQEDIGLLSTSIDHMSDTSVYQASEGNGEQHTDVEDIPDF